MHKEFGNKGFEIISISLDKEQDRAKYKQFIKDNKMDWLHIMDGQYWNAALAKKFGIHGIPAVYLVDPKGQCVADESGLHIHQETDFRMALGDAMKKTPPTSTGNRKTGRARQDLETADKLCEKKDYAKALQAYEKIAAADKQGEIGKKAAAKAKEMKADKEIAKAIRAADAAKKAPGLLRMAAQLAEAGKPEKAREYYQKVIDKYPETEYAEQAHAAIDKLSG